MEPTSSNDQLIKDIVEMGFSENAAKRAYLKADLKNVEGCVNWLSEHLEDPDINDPLPENATAPSPAPAPGPGQAGGEGKPTEVIGKSISSMVNQEMAKKLQAMGHSKNVSEKALLCSGGKSVEAAVEWIYANMNEPDFEEEMRLLGDESGESSKPREVKIMSEEEKLEAAKALQKQVRENRMKKEKEEAEEREKARIKSTKELAAAKRQMDEEEIKRFAETKARERTEDEKAKQKILDEIQKDREERFGKQAPPPTKMIPPIDQVKEVLKKIKTVYPTHSYKEQLRSLITAIKSFVENVLKSPTEEKFQKINQSNPKFQERVGSIIGGVRILHEIGFEEKDGFLILKKPTDTKLLEDVVKLMDYELYYLT